MLFRIIWCSHLEISSQSNTPTSHSRELSSFSLTIFMSIITFTILDKIILFFIHVHFHANKLVLQGITKLDMYLWRKTGRDTVVTNFIWKLQRKYMSRSKKERKIMTMAFVGMIGTYYGWMILT